MRESPSRPRYFGWAVVLILLGGFGLRTWGIAQNSLWIDESTTMTYVQASFSQTMTYISEDASHEPVHFIILRLFSSRNSELFLRLPSLLAAIIGMGVLIFTVIRLTGNYKLALLAGLLLAVDPYHIWLSRTGRAYSLLFTLSLINTCCFLILLRGDRRRINWGIYIASGMCAYMTHYFALMLPAAQYILFGFILPRRRGFFRRWFWAQVVMGIPLGLWAIQLMRQERIALGTGWIPRPGLDDVLLTIWNMTLDYTGRLPWYTAIGLVGVAVGLALGVYYAWTERKTEWVNFYWFWMLLVPIGAAFAVSVFIQPFYVDRYFVVALPSIIMLMINGWQHISYPAVRNVLASVVVLASLGSVLDTYQHGYDEREDWRAVTAYIEQEYLPGDGLLVEMPDRFFPIRIYWQGGDLIDHAWLAAGSDEAEPLIEQYDQPIKRIWAVYRNPFDDGHRQNLMPDFDPFAPSKSPMPDWLASHRDQVLSIKAFKGVTVVLVDVHDEFQVVGD